MFKKIWPNGIKSDEGYCIKRTDRFALEYEENGKKLIVEVESGIRDLAIYTSTIKQWSPPNDSEIITVEEKNRIVENIKKAMDFAEWKYVIE